MRLWQAWANDRSFFLFSVTSCNEFIVTEFCFMVLLLYIVMRSASLEPFLPGFEFLKTLSVWNISLYIKEVLIKKRITSWKLPSQFMLEKFENLCTLHNVTCAGIRFLLVFMQSHTINTIGNLRNLWSDSKCIFFLKKEAFLFYSFSWKPRQKIKNIQVLSHSFKECAGFLILNPQDFNVMETVIIDSKSLFG